MKKNILFKLVLISLIFNLSSPLFCENSADAKENKDEIPQALQDLRRFEIISLGSLPFVLLDANLVYSGVKYFQSGMDSNQFPSLSPNLTTEEQTGILLTSVGISLGIGLTDLIVNLVKRSKKTKKAKPVEKPIIINPISEDPNAIKLPTLEELNNEKSEREAENTEEVIEIKEDDN